jgi:hypothetical protein
MNRRKFISQTGKLVMATAIPYILPTGRLFAATEMPKVRHVVFCLFAGGIRRWESIDFKDGNLMPNTLVGDSAIASDIYEGIQKVPKVLETPIQKNGTLLKGFRYNSTFTHHYPAHTSAISGKYYYTNEMFKPIRYPSIFEYFRKHSTFGQAGINTWLVADKPGDFPYMQYSQHPDYGVKYAANMIQPSTLFKFNFLPPLKHEKEMQLRKMIELLNPDTISNTTNHSSGINTFEEREQIKNLVQNLSDKHFKDEKILWSDLDSKLVNQDMITMFTASEILKTFHPNLLVVNMQDSDIGHFSYTGYCDNLHRADYALGKIWQTIQNDPILKDNTVLIAQPEFGRNKISNSIIDPYGRYAVDHNGDEISQQMFCLIAGPSNVIQQNKVIEANYGEAIDTVPTIAHLMGFDKSIPPYFITGNVLYEALV